MITNKEYLDSIEIIPLLDTLRLQKIDDSIYFSKKYNGYISNSRLSLINPAQDGSPEKFFKGFKPIYSTALDLGSNVHALALQEDLFLLVDSVEKPTAKMGALADRLYSSFLKGEISAEKIIKEATIVDYYKGNLNEKKLAEVRIKCEPYWASRRQFESTYTGDKVLIYSDKKSRETVCNCVRALKSNKYIQDLLYPTDLMGNKILAENEQAILLDIQVNMPNKESFILSLKAKLDNYTIDKEYNVITVNDIKTIGKIVSEMQNNINKFHYNREFAVYSYLLSLCAKKYYNLDNPIVKGNYLVVSTIPDYYTKVISLTKSMYKEGMDEFRYLLKLVAYYYSKGFRFE